LKTIVRVLIIVLVIGIISLGVYWVVERSFGTQSGVLSAANGSELGDFRRGDRGGQFNGALPPDGPGGTGNFPGGFRDHDRNFREGTFGWYGILKSLGTVAATTLVVILVQKGLAWLKHKKISQPAG